MRTIRLWAVWALGTVSMVCSVHASAQEVRPTQPGNFQDSTSRAPTGSATGTFEAPAAANSTAPGPGQTGVPAAAPAPVTTAPPTATGVVAPVALPANQVASANPTAEAAPSSSSAESKPDINKAGTLGFGAGLLGGSGASPVTLGSDLNFRIWATDMVALQPSLVSNVDYDKTSHTTVYRFSPQIEVVLAAYRHKANRVNLGIGVGYGMQGVHVQVTDAVSTDSSQNSVFVPLELQLEHFFASWFSLQVGTRCTALRYTTSKPATGSSSYAVASGIDSTVLKLGFMFYTD